MIKQTRQLYFYGAKAEPEEKSFTYISRSLIGYDRDRIERLQIAARDRNLADNITGFLYYDGQNFLQTIEGPTEAIDHLIIRLLQDPRHEHVQVLRERTIASRRFGAWSLGTLCGFELSDAQHVVALAAGGFAAESVLTMESLFLSQEVFRRKLNSTDTLAPCQEKPVIQILPVN